MSHRHTTRRSVLKAIGAGTALSGASAVAGATDDDRRVDPEEVELPYPDTKYVTVGDDVYDAVGHHWWLLTLDRDRIDGLLRTAPVSSSEVQTHSERVTTLRDTYGVEQSEVTTTRGGREHTYHLTDTRVSSLSRERRIEVAETASAVLDGFAAEGDSQDVSTNWYAKAHRKQAAYVLDEFNVDDYDADKLRKNTDDPDEFGCESCQVDWLPVSIPNAVENAVESAVRGLGDDSEAKHPPFHFYLGDPPSVTIDGYTISAPKFGGAPGEAQYFVGEANDAYTGSGKAKHLGFACHYLQDMSVPFHSGAIWEQLNYSPTLTNPLNFDPRRDIHYAYEEEINQNLENAAYYAGDPFVTDFQDGYPYYVPDVGQGCRDLATFAGKYGPDIFESVLNGGKDSPWDWDDGDRSVFEKTHNCMSEAGNYLRGFLYNHYDYNW